MWLAYQREKETEGERADRYENFLPMMGKNLPVRLMMTFAALCSETGSCQLSSQRHLTEENTENMKEGGSKVLQQKQCGHCAVSGEGGKKKKEKKVIPQLHLLDKHLAHRQRQWKQPYRSERKSITFHHFRQDTFTHTFAHTKIHIMNITCHFYTVE